MSPMRPSVSQPGRRDRRPGGVHADAVRLPAALERDAALGARRGEDRHVARPGVQGLADHQSGLDPAIEVLDARHPDDRDEVAVARAATRSGTRPRFPRCRRPSLRSSTCHWRMPSSRRRRPRRCRCWTIPAGMSVIGMRVENRNPFTAGAGGDEPQAHDGRRGAGILPDALAVRGGRLSQPGTGWNVRPSSTEYDSERDRQRRLRDRRRSRRSYTACRARSTPSDGRSKPRYCSSSART